MSVRVRPVDITLNKHWRRWLHLIGGSFFPILALFVPNTALLIPLAIVAGALTLLEIVRLKIPQLNQWMILHLGEALKPREQSQATGATYLLLASVIVFLFPDKYVAITSLLFLSIGDLMAKIIGEKYGHRVLFKKSIEGSFACLVSCLSIGILISRITPTISLPIAIIGAVSATIVELLPSPIDDNLTIPIISALMMTLSALYFG
ncbi:MAG: hypothetical protein AAC990_04430 [Dehalococcoides mccartyi]|uniref:Phosphatidate cytidylyltransferase n=1 Tax=Dehalococcoides mccartyi TaxID=61435 RepID=A0AB38Z7Y0_9CHLR|nr:hypothetical protein [Dehalococcoides mccartyi]WRO06688.1 hypothetical protein VLL09_04680 [Dehalococcoides mccartyi]